MLADRGRVKHTTLVVAEWKLRRIPGWMTELLMFVYILLEKTAQVLLFSSLSFRLRVLIERNPIKPW